MELTGDIARKTGDTSLLRIELEKSRRAARIGAESGLFRVPAVLGFDETAGVLEFERVHDLATFGSMVSRAGDPQREDLATRAGRALARVHLDLRLDDSWRIPLPSAWAGAGSDEVFIHGDFTTNNVCIDESNDELVIIDWSAARLVGGAATLGPRGFDVMFFVRHLLMGATWRQALTWPANRLCRLFVSAYVGDYGTALDSTDWQRHRRLMNSFSKQVVRDRVSSTPLLKKPGKLLLQLAQYRSWHAFRPPPESLTRAIV